MGRHKRYTETATDTGKLPRHAVTTGTGYTGGAKPKLVEFRNGDGRLVEVVMANLFGPWKR